MGFFKAMSMGAGIGTAALIDATGIGKKSKLPTTPAVPQPTMINANTQQVTPSLLNTKSLY